MVWPLILSFATIGLSLTNKRNKDPIVVPNTTLVLAGEDRLFVTGAVLGLGCSLLLSTLTSYFRVREHTRMLWLYLTNTDEHRELFPYRSPTALLHSKQHTLLEESRDGTVGLLVSSRTAPTSHLNVHVLTLAADCEIPSRHAPGVEFYYVITGEGTFSQQGVAKTQLIRPGDCFVVDVGHMRWIRSARRGVEPLVLLRATDGGPLYTNGSYKDAIRLDPNHKTTSLEALSCGLRKMQETANGYYRKTKEDSKEGRF